MKRGRSLPRWYLNEPDDSFPVDWYMASFWHLHSERPAGFGVMSIPWSKIQAYAEHERLAPMATRVLHGMIRVLDATFMDWAEEKRKRESGNEKRRARRQRRGGKG